MTTRVPIIQCFIINEQQVLFACLIAIPRIQLSWQTALEKVEEEEEIWAL